MFAFNQYPHGETIGKFAVLPLLLLFAIHTAFAGEAVKVKTVTLAEVADYPKRFAPATVVSLNESTISAEIAARVVALPVRVGDVVEAGALLSELDCSDYLLTRQEVKARLDSLDARIELARRRLERTQKLTQQQSVSKELLDERVSDLAVLQADQRSALADFNMAKLNISRCRVVSPFRALITARMSAVGQYAKGGSELVRVMDMEHLEVSAQVFNQDTRQIREAGAFHFEYSGQSYPLKLRSILPAINPETRNREVRLDFVNGQALPGAAGKLVWRDSRPHIPGNLLVRRDGKLGVFYAKNGVARFKVIEGAQQGRSSPVDLSDTTLLIIEGHYGLEDAAPIFVIN